MGEIQPGRTDAPSPPPPTIGMRLFMALAWGLLGGAAGAGGCGIFAAIASSNAHGPDGSGMGEAIYYGLATVGLGIAGLLGGAIFGAVRCYRPAISRGLLRNAAICVAVFMILGMIFGAMDWDELRQLAEFLMFLSLGATFFLGIFYLAGLTNPSRQPTEAPKAEPGKCES